MNKKIVSEKYLQGESKYVFCPYCVTRMEKEGKDWRKILRPLKKVVTSEPVKESDGTISHYVDDHYECSNCRFTNITVDTFMRIYTETAEQRKERKGENCD